MASDVLIRAWKQPEMRVDANASDLAAHPSGTGLGELTRNELRSTVAPFQAKSSGWVCTLTDECPNSVLVCC